MTNRLECTVQTKLLTHQILKGRWKKLLWKIPDIYYSTLEEPEIELKIHVRFQMPVLIKGTEMTHE